MPTQRSAQDLLMRLEAIHLNGGRVAFQRVLVDIRVSQISSSHVKLARSVRRDAKGLRMLDEACVKTTRAHIIAEWQRTKKRRPVAFQSGIGHAVVR